MKTGLLLLMTVSLMLVFLPAPTIAGGEELTFLMADGKEIKGELLSVRSESFMITPYPGESEEKLRENSGGVMELRKSDVKSVEFEGSSHVLLGMGVGFGGGMLLGGAIGAAAGGGSDTDILDELDTAMGGAAGALVGGLVGLGIGTVVGIATSSDDRVVDVGSLPNLEYFKGYARYRYEEPEFLGGASR